MEGRYYVIADGDVGAVEGYALKREAEEAIALAYDKGADDVHVVYGIEVQATISLPTITGVLEISRAVTRRVRT